MVIAIIEAMETEGETGIAHREMIIVGNKVPLPVRITAINARHRRKDKGRVQAIIAINAHHRDKGKVQITAAYQDHKTMPMVLRATTMTRKNANGNGKRLQRKILAATISSKDKGEIGRAHV